MSNVHRTWPTRSRPLNPLPSYSPSPRVRSALYRCVRTSPIRCIRTGRRRAALVLPTPITVGAVAEAFRHLVAPGSEILVAHVARDVFRRGIEAAGFPVSRGELAAARAWGRRVARWLGRFRGTWDAAAHAAWFMAVESSRDGPDFATRWLGDTG